MKSFFDPSRETVGTIARDAIIKNFGIPVPCGDITHEVIPDLIKDINEALMIPCEKPFYLLLTEKKDLQMKNADIRDLRHLSYRPYPESNTTVFWKDPKKQELRFCWDLPHWSQMQNILMNPLDYAPELIDQVTAWKKNDLTKFGFYFHPRLRWIPNPSHKDRRLS